MDAAMVQIIENHAEIAGDLRAMEKDPARPGFVTLHIAVGSVLAIDPWPDFFTRDIGRTIAVSAPADSAMASLPPGPVRLRVKKTGLTTAVAELIVTDAR